MKTTIAPTAPAYRADGVNLDAGDSISTFAAGICRASYNNCPFIRVRDWSNGQFRGPRTFRLTGLEGDWEFSADMDGNGTKPILTVAANTPEQAARDLVEMTGMDGVRYGGRPVVLVDQLDASSLGEEGTERNLFFRMVFEGLGRVASEDGFVLLKGETAEMGVCVGSEDPNPLVKFLLCGTMISIFHPDFCITGENLATGQLVMALREYGLRANGGSSARKALAMRYGAEWYRNPEAKSAVKAAAVPSTAYGRFLTDLNGWNDIHKGKPVPKIHVRAIAHITGGGIPAKFFEGILKPAGFSVTLDNLWTPPAIMLDLAVWRQISGKEIYDIWHGGQGALVVIDEGDRQRFIDLAESAGVSAKVAGVIRKDSNPTLRIHSRFDGRELCWE